jgi:linoleoyl-CoA desaturase
MGSEPLTVSMPETASRPKFVGHSSFQNTLRKRVEEYFLNTGKRPRDCPAMYLKTAIILSLFATSYVLLVFVVQSWWLSLPLVVLLGGTMACIGFNIQHDGGHQAYSDYPWVNKLMAMTLDLIGGSSYMWHWKHAVLHHTYVNIDGHDTDIDLGILGRLSPHQKRCDFHRWQHFYLWPLYGLIAIKWHLYDDFHDLWLGHLRGQRVPRPKRWDLVVFLLGKIVFFSLAFVLPLLLHSWLVVLVHYLVGSLTLGIVISVVFQLAHCVEEAEFPQPDPATLHVEKSWAEHQTETTVDFSRYSRVAHWLLGGLNFQIEHHLMPRICHIHYPALSRVVEATCREFGVRYAAHASFWAGIRSHYRWLRQMGKPEVLGSGTTATYVPEPV